MSLNKKLVIILMVLVIIRISMAIALIYGFPEKGSYAGGYFYLGDEDEYFKLAFSLAKFKPVDSFRTLGFPILLLPFIWITHAGNLEKLLLPVAIFHSCVLAPISIILVALIAKELTKEWKVAIFSASIWTFFPYLVYIFAHTNPSFCKDVPAMRMAHQAWLQALSDPPSTLSALLAIYTFILSLDRNKLLLPILAGLFLSLATLIKPGNIVLIILFLPLYIFNKNIKKLLLFLLSGLFIFIPQFLYNLYFYGSPFKFNTLWSTDQSYALELNESTGRTFDIISLQNFFFSIQQIIKKFSILPLLSIAVFCLLTVFGLFKISMESRRAAMILSLWILAYFLSYAGYLNFYNSLLHFLMPAIPAFIIIISMALRKNCIYQGH